MCYLFTINFLNQQNILLIWQQLTLKKNSSQPCAVPSSATPSPSKKQPSTSTRPPKGQVTPISRRFLYGYDGNCRWPNSPSRSQTGLSHPTKKHHQTEMECQEGRTRQKLKRINSGRTPFGSHALPQEPQIDQTLQRDLHHNNGTLVSPVAARQTNCRTTCSGQWTDRATTRPTRHRCQLRVQYHRGRTHLFFRGNNCHIQFLKTALPALQDLLSRHSEP